MDDKDENLFKETMLKTINSDVISIDDIKFRPGSLLVDYESL